mmetsp:Transcript_125414/g.250307  ORF Transcript_125414/g.250307 Transcript_125414/m.250307 type:complete len:214 (-) Transcript_125414:149-790(-)
MDDLAGKRARMEVNADPVITLNVGGTRKQTRRSTLTWSSRYFKNIFDGPFKPEDGELFLDCDIVTFEYVLYFFRHHRLPRDAPMEKVKDVANMFSVDKLVEETERRLECERLVGTWHYEIKDVDEKCTDNTFEIYEKELQLWFHVFDVDLDEHLHGQLKKDEDRYIVQEKWGSWHLRPSGQMLLVGEGESGEDAKSMRTDVLAIRKPPRAHIR